jgi:hypothetical protein
MFYIIPLTDILIFAVPLYFAFRTRLDPPAHKRFIYIATITLLTPANRTLAVRFCIPEVSRCSFARRKLFARLGWLRSMVYAPDPSGDAVGRSFLIFMLQTRVPMGKTAA